MRDFLLMELRGQISPNLHLPISNQENTYDSKKEMPALETLDLKKMVFCNQNYSDLL